MMVFNKLSQESILKVVDLRLNDIAARIKDRRITLDVDQRARGWLADAGYSNVYGARAIARVVRTMVLFPLAQKLLKGTIRFVSLSYLNLASGFLIHVFITGTETLSSCELAQMGKILTFKRIILQTTKLQLLHLPLHWQIPNEKIRTNTRTLIMKVTLFHHLRNHLFCSSFFIAFMNPHSIIVAIQNRGTICVVYIKT